MESPKTLTFKVIRKNPELISPAEATPNEFKFLSDIDDQDGLRILIPCIHFYKANTFMEGKDPVSCIRHAIAKALVFYYPLAGRLREYPGRKLVVECTGDGVVFVEADADVMLHHFGDALYPPFSCLDELLLDIPRPPGSNGIINCPLLFIQVTRLRCGGFIFAYLFNHTMCDGAGLFQFMSAVGELCRGGAAPSIAPVWERHLLWAHHPPQVSFTHREYDVVTTSETSIPNEKIVDRSFFFDAADISTLHRSLPPHLQNCSKFEVVAACVWRCRTIAISRKPNEKTKFLCVVDIRKRMKPPLPLGYYGNGSVFLPAVATVEELSKNPLHYAVEKVRNAKNKATNEYVKSIVDQMVVRDRPRFCPKKMTYMVSDMTHSGFEQVDFGWGKAAYGSIAIGVTQLYPTISWYIPFKNKMGEDGIMVPISLPLNVMEDFEKYLKKIIMVARKSSGFNASAL